MPKVKHSGTGGVLLVGALVAVAVSAFGASREEAVLSWDDGTWENINHQTTGQVGMKLAVMFQAPEWASWVTEIHYYIGDDLLGTPTESFLACVWEPDEETPTLPGDAANIGVDSGSGYPEAAWLEVSLPEAVNITDSAAFPDRVFFVGLEWLSRQDPHLAYDDSEPVNHMSWFFNWATWELYVYGDVMIRVVVTDSWTSPVERGTWSHIKALFR